MFIQTHKQIWPYFGKIFILKRVYVFLLLRPIMVCWLLQFVSLNSQSVNHSINQFLSQSVSPLCTRLRQQTEMAQKLSSSHVNDPHSPSRTQKHPRADLLCASGACSSCHVLTHTHAHTWASGKEICCWRHKNFDNLINNSKQQQQQEPHPPRRTQRRLRLQSSWVPKFQLYQSVCVCVSLCVSYALMLSIWPRMR